LGHGVNGSEGEAARQLLRAEIVVTVRCVVRGCIVRSRIPKRIPPQPLEPAEEHEADVGERVEALGSLYVIAAVCRT
jgi:hypothetical protein